MLCVLIRIASSRRFKWVHSTCHYHLEGRKIPKLPSFASWPGVMINPHWLELPISRTNLHGPKDVRAIGVRLYILKGKQNRSQIELILSLKEKNMLFLGANSFILELIPFQKTGNILLKKKLPPWKCIQSPYKDLFSHGSSIMLKTYLTSSSFDYWQFLFR